MKTYIARHPEGNLSYIGHLAPEQLTRVYSTADIGLCIYAEGSNVAMPDKVYDYMAAGLPMINSLCGELASLLNLHGAGLQYATGNAKSLAERLIQLASDGNARRIMGRAAFDAAQEFDSASQYRVLPGFIEKVCSFYHDAGVSAFCNVEVI